VGDDAGVAIEVSEETGRTVVAVVGEVDMRALEVLRDAIEPRLGPHQTLVLDLAGVTFTDSTLIKVLAHARSRVAADGGRIILRNPSTVARRILTLTQAQDLVDAIEGGRRRDVDATPPPTEAEGGAAQSHAVVQSGT
jgi:anti-sigma B factor antagonist